MTNRFGLTIAALSLVVAVGSGNAWAAGEQTDTGSYNGSSSRIDSGSHPGRAGRDTGAAPAMAAAPMHSHHYRHHHHAQMHAKNMPKAGGHGTKAMASRYSGDTTTDALNRSSLEAARGGSAPPPPAAGGPTPNSQ